jgi:hypothetical protein
LLLSATLVFLARLFLLIPWKRLAGRPRVLENSVTVND